MKAMLNRIEELEKRQVTGEGAWKTGRPHAQPKQHPTAHAESQQQSEYVPEHLAFKITGISEDEEENDREVARKVEAIIRSRMEQNPEYAKKTRDKVDFKITSARRIGKSGDRPRMVYVTVASSFDATSLVRNRRFLKGSGVSVFDYLTKEELEKHKKNLPSFEEARKDPSKWVYFRRGELRITERSPGGGGDVRMKDN